MKIKCIIPKAINITTLPFTLYVAMLVVSCFVVFIHMVDDLL